MNKEDEAQIVVSVGTSDNGAVIVEMAEVPSVLAVGTTGSGKSSFVKTLVGEMMHRNDPREVRFLICDSSRVEYACLGACPHLGVPILRDTTQLSALIRWVSTETERRLLLLSRHAPADYPHLFLVLDDFVALCRGSSRWATPWLAESWTSSKREVS